MIHQANAPNVRRNTQVHKANKDKNTNLPKMNV